MKKLLSKSFRVINNNLILIFLVIVFDLSLIFSKRYANNNVLLTLLALAASFFVTCGAFASLWQYAKEGEYDFSEGFSKNWIRYLSAHLIFFIAATAVGLVIALLINKGQLPSKQAIRTLEGILIINVYGFMFRLLSLYISPYVFSKGEGADAVFDSIKYLFKNIQSSMLPIIIILTMSLLITTSKLTQLNISGNQAFALECITTSITSFLNCLVFIIACFILNNDK